MQSRYYDPETGRFLDADSHINANGDLQGFNMYAYCSNNSVVFKAMNILGQNKSVLAVANKNVNYAYVFTCYFTVHSSSSADDLSIPNWVSSLLSV